MTDRDLEILRHRIDLLGDPERAARVDVALHTAAAARGGQYHEGGNPRQRCPHCPQRVRYADGRIDCHVCGDPVAISAWIEAHAREAGLPWPPPTIGEMLRAQAAGKAIDE